MIGFVVDGYNRYDKWDREHSVYTFTMNGASFAIKEVQIVNGQPEFPTRIEEERNTNMYFIFESHEAAYQYVREIKALNCTP